MMYANRIVLVHGLHPHVVGRVTGVVHGPWPVPATQSLRGVLPKQAGLLLPLLLQLNGR